MTPTPQQIQAFIQVYYRLERYEVMQRFTRGYGAFDPEELEKMPDPNVTIVIEWLEKLAADVDIKHVMEKLANDG